MEQKTSARECGRRGGRWVRGIGVGRMKSWVLRRPLALAAIRRRCGEDERAGSLGAQGAQAMHVSP